MMNSASDKPLVSLVVPAKNEGLQVRATLESVMQVRSACTFEIIVVDDGSSDGCCDFIATHESAGRTKLVRTEGIGAANARNLGAGHSVGSYLIFCDAHLLFEDFWIDRLIEPIREGAADATTPGIAPNDAVDVIGCGQTLDRHLGVTWNGWRPEIFPCAVLSGGCMAVSRDVFFDVGGFDTGFKRWGYEDVELSMKMWLFGYKCYAVPSVKILHVFRKVHPYPVAWEDIYYNMMRMAFSHFSPRRIDECKSLIRYADAAPILTSLLNSGVEAQRRAYKKRRIHDDDWYMEKFGISF